MIVVSSIMSIKYNFGTVNTGKTVALSHRPCSQEFSSETVKNGDITKALHQVAIYLSNEKRLRIALLLSLTECY